MEDLVKAATQVLDERYNSPIHKVAAALRTKDGRVITAVNIDHFLGFVCAETAALAIGINENVYDFTEIVAVRRDAQNEEVKIVSMCGKCRQIFHDYTPGIDVLTPTGVKKIEDLLPDAFLRQRLKIQNVIKVHEENNKE